MWQWTPQGSAACLGAFGKMSGIECKHFLCSSHSLLLLLKFRIPSQFCFLCISFFCTPSQFCSPCLGLWKCLLRRLWFIKRDWILLRLLRDWLTYMHVHSQISVHRFIAIEWWTEILLHVPLIIIITASLIVECSVNLFYSSSRRMYIKNYVNTDHIWSWFGKNLERAPLD